MVEEKTWVSVGDPVKNIQHLFGFELGGNYDTITHSSDVSNHVYLTLDKFYHKVWIHWQNISNATNDRTKFQVTHV
jgi:hypothetical protein